MERLVYKGKDIEVKSYSRAGEIFWNHLSVSDWEPLSVKKIKSKELEMFYDLNLKCTYPRSNNETPGFQENRVSWKHTKWSTCFGVHYPSSGPYQSNS